MLLASLGLMSPVPFPSNHMRRMGAGFLGKVLQEQTRPAEKGKQRAFSATVLPVNLNENSSFFFFFKKKSI